MEVSECKNKSHKNCSKLPKDKVPTNMFLKDPDNPRSKKLSNCLDCRNVSNEVRRKK